MSSLATWMETMKLARTWIGIANLTHRANSFTDELEEEGENVRRRFSNVLKPRATHVKYVVQALARRLFEILGISFSGIGQGSLVIITA